MDCAVAPGRHRKIPLLLAAILAWGAASGSDGLRVEDPAEVAFSVAALTEQARAMGFTDSGVAAAVQDRLTRAGFSGRRSDPNSDSDVLFIDIIVEDETFYTSLGFWRLASYRLPDGELNSEFVTVWQDYAVGAHHDDPAKVRATFDRIIERFIVKYSKANSDRVALRIASLH